MSSVFRDQMADSLIANVRKHGEKIFETPPEQAVDNLMREIRDRGFIVKMFIKSKWKDFKTLLDNPNDVFNRVKEKDPEVYDILIKHMDWIERFLARLRDELEKYLFS